MPDETRGLRYVLAPAGMRSRAPHPVLVFLHGHDEGAPLEMQHALTRHGPLRPGNPALTLEQFIVVAPQLPQRGDLWERHADGVYAILRRVQEQHGGDPRRSYLSGFSFGGNGVFDLAQSQPDAWAALWPVDPTRLPRGDPGRPVWLSFGEVARHRKDLFIAALNLRDAEEDLQADRVYLDEGEDHVGSARHAYRDERIYRWLLSKRG